MIESSIRSPVFNAANVWKERCLIEGGSLFSEQALWTQENFDALQDLVTNVSDVYTRNEFVKRELELIQGRASHNVKALWAEVMWLYYLPVPKSYVGYQKQSTRIRTPWEWSGLSFSDSEGLLGAEILENPPYVDPGTYYQTNHWYEMELIVNLMVHWFHHHSKSQREALLAAPWDFARWVYSVEATKGRSFAPALLYLLFPNDFVVCMSQNHKRLITKRWLSERSNSSNLDDMSPMEIDKELLIINDRLKLQQGLEVISFYESPFWDYWHPKSKETRNEDWFKNRFGDANVWVIGTGENAQHWNEFLETQCVRFGYDANIGDLGPYSSWNDLHQARIALDSSASGKSSTMAWNFSSRMRPGDLLLAKKGMQEFLGLGRVTGEYRFDPNRSTHMHYRMAEWYPFDRSIVLGTWAPDSVILFDSPTRFWLARNAFIGLNLEFQEKILRSVLPEPPVETTLHPKNKIIQGPPGTGKTWMAESLAVEIIDGHSNETRYARARYSELVNDGRIAFVTFHQNYAYEEFVEGIRPVLPDNVAETQNRQVGYELRTGLFKDLCARAKQFPDRRFVLIIDEINRGNVAKIFGELITLIEDSRRLGSKHETTATLQYSGDVFGVPNNLFIVGTMNTADRSIQLLDTALRRRFRFLEYMPNPDHDEIQKSVDGIKLRLLIRTINDRISVLLDREHQIGHTYFFNVKTVAELAERFKYQIFPLLQEYFFDDWSKINRVLGDNDFVTKQKVKDLGLGEITDEVDPICYERRVLEDNVWTQPEQYRKIYQSSQED